MLFHDLQKFKDLIKKHKSANHPLFNYLETAVRKDKVTPEMYLLFSTNIAARTMMSLSEIHACCIQASFDLDPLRTAYSVMTGAEEGGSGKPTEVHTVLMMNALNYHGKVVFGLDYIDLRYLMALMRLLYTSHRQLFLLKLENLYPGVSQNLHQSGLVDLAELKDTCKRMAYIANIELPQNPWDDIRKMDQINELAKDKLYSSNLLQETIDYCLSQFDVLQNKKAGYLQGVSFAHEGLADGMIYKIFRIIFSHIEKYTSIEEFKEIVYPYFEAHGNYMEVFNGLAMDTEGVEATHAQRELEKLAQLDADALEEAWLGANNFADRNVSIWDAMMNVFELRDELEVGLSYKGKYY